MVSNHVITIRIDHAPQSHTVIRTECARLWNRMVALHLWFRKRRLSWPTETQFKAHFKGRFVLHSQTIQGVIERFFDNIDTTRTNRANGDKRARYPYKTKSYVVAVWKPLGIDRNKQCLTLSMGRKRKPVILHLPKKFPKGKITLVQLGFNEFYVTLATEIKVPKRRLKGVAAGDLGVIHLMMMTDGKETESVVGRGLRSVIQGHNKAKAEISSLLSKCTKGSKRYKRLRYALFREGYYRQNFQRNFLHHAANHVVDFCKRKKVGTFYVGDITEMVRGKSGKRSRRNNQDVANMPWGDYIKYLTYKLAKRNVGLEKQSEAYTSQTCPQCASRTKVSGRVYKCRVCKFTAPRDQVGSWNFLNKCVNGSIISGAMVPDGKLNLPTAKSRGILGS